MSGTASAAGTERIELRGAQASEAVVPLSLDVDLRDLPAPKEWEPGDAIKEIPRRHQRPIKGIVDPPEGEFVDPLLDAQDAPSATPDLDFATPIVNIAGQGYTGVNPPDPNGDVGPSHYIQSINQSSGSRITVYSKTGTVLSGPFTLASLGGTGACATGLGDPIVLYDPLADRWMLSEFASTGNHLCVYVSKTSNPVSGGWWFYDFTTPNFPDYPKYGVWPDAYYVGTNEGTPAVYALDRVKMLSGLAATSQRFTATALSGFGFQMLTPADVDGAAPPAGSPGIFVRHRDSEAHGASGAADTLEVFTFTVNWTNPANSVFANAANITVTEFDSALCGLTSFNCFPQPGSATTLDPLREVVMFRAQYRNRGTFQSLVGNLVTDVNGADRGGIRWFELRKTGTNPWTLYMEGTYSPDTTNRWMGSAAVDKNGNLAVGYSVSASASIYPGLRFAGRLAGDPAGALSQGETTLVAGAAANGSNRWGDYASLSVDPSDDCTFWFTGEYSPASSWGTRIGSFKFASCGGTPTPDFSISCTPSSVSANPGGSATSTCTVTSLNGFASAVNLSCTGLPAGASCAFSPASVTPPSGGSANSTLTVSLTTSAAPGTYAFSVQGVSGTLTRTASMSLTVNSTGCGQLPTFSATPNAAIPDNNTTGVTSTINVASSLTITSVSVNVGITHTYQGDLEVALIGPDNTTVLLHNRTGAGTDNINTTYNITTRSAQALTVFNGKNTSGAWKLRVRDLAAADTGTLNSWKLTFNGYYTVTPNIAIPDNNTSGVTSTINVPAGAALVDLRVRVGITHTYQGDLEVALIGPDNTTVLLHNRTGGTTDNIQTVYPDLTAPAQALTAFTGKTICGAWKLRVRDLAASDTGTLNSWEIDFR